MACIELGTEFAVEVLIGKKGINWDINKIEQHTETKQTKMHFGNTEGIAYVSHYDGRVAVLVSEEEKDEEVMLDIMIQIPFKEGGEESYAFLNFFLPDLETARRVNDAFKTNGVDACFHYFDNNWHYIRKWDHLVNLNSLYPISPAVKEGLAYLKETKFEKSDHYIGRNLSCLIKMSWSEEQVHQRGQLMADIIKSCL